MDFDRENKLSGMKGKEVSAGGLHEVDSHEFNAIMKSRRRGDCPQINQFDFQNSC